MKLVLDEDIPRQLARRFEEAGHTAVHLEQLGWKGIKNGDLLRRISGEYDVLVTGDTNMPTSRTSPASTLRSFSSVRASRS